MKVPGIVGKGTLAGSVGALVLTAERGWAWYREAVADAAVKLQVAIDKALEAQALQHELQECLEEVVRCFGP